MTEKKIKRFVDTLVGVEIEVENTPEDNVPRFPGWTIKRDDSLRNNGYEYVTAFGTRIHHLPAYLKTILDSMRVFSKANPGLFEFNERTSIHVHIDVTKLSLEELKNVLLVYTLFEDSLFRIAGDIRRHNIFCVPFRYLAMSDVTNDIRFDRMIAGWKKYCAINFTRTMDLGTVEFRHMEGNNDYRRVLLWTCLLAMLVDYCRTVNSKFLEEEIRKLKYISHYYQFTEEVFGPFSPFLQIVPHEFDQAVSDAKILFSTKV